MDSAWARRVTPHMRPVRCISQRERAYSVAVSMQLAGIARAHNAIQRTVRAGIRTSREQFVRPRVREAP